MRSRTDPDPAPQPVWLRVLGPVQVDGPAGPARLIGARQRTVIGLLALRAGTLVPQSRLVDGLWGDDPPRTAVRSLHSHIARVRQALEAAGRPDALVTREPGYLLAAEPEQVDAGRFEAAARQGRAALATGAPDRAAGLLREALARWRGELALADAEPRGWAASEVDRLAEARLAAVEDRWDAELRLGGHAEAIGEVERLLVAYPLRERLVGLLMLARYRAGRPTEALVAYQRLRSGLADELGVDPGPELVRLHARILRRDPELERPAPPDRELATGAELVPGSAPEPEPSSATPAAAPDSASADPPAATPATPRPAQLPAPVGHFTSRDQELAGLDALLAEPDGGTRIAVISGLAGMGKTALALQWAHRVAGRFPDGQLFLDLRGHEAGNALTPAAALSHLLRALWVPADRVPAEPAEQAGLYRSLLHGRRILVVLDNAGSAESVLPLVPAGPGNLLLVTSRRTLAALTTHHAVTTVELDALAGDDAVALLGKVLGAPRVAREPGPATELAGLCGGMPLALRIAAAKLVGQPSQRLQELVAALAGRDRLAALSVDGDTRSVRTVFASAYRGLRPPAARLFRLLGLHPGPTFSAGLAAALTGTGPDPGEARQALAELAAAHLVVDTGPDRYRFHDLIALFARQYAVADEPEPARAAAAERLLDWYLATTHAANRILDPGRDRVTPALRQPVPAPQFHADHHAALEFLDAERANVLPVVRYAAGNGHHTAAWQLTYLLTGYYDSRGHWAERIEMCRWAVAAAEQTGEAAAEGLMRSGLGVAYLASRRYEKALAALSSALPLMQAAGDLRGEGHVYNNIAAAYTDLRRYDEAIGAFQEALARHTASGHRLGVALAHYNLGHVHIRQRRASRSLAHLTEALTISHDLDAPRIEAAILVGLGEAHLQLGSHQRALRYYQRAVALRRRIGDRRVEPDTLCDLGVAHLQQGDRDAAVAQFQRAQAVSRQIADPHSEAVALRHLGAANLDAGDLTAAREHLQRAITLRARAPDAYQEAELYRTVGDLENANGDRTEAERCWDRARRLYHLANATQQADQVAERVGTRDAPAPPPAVSVPAAPSTAGASTAASAAGDRPPVPDIDLGLPDPDLAD